MMNLIGEIAQYAIETDQVIRALVKERDDLKNTINAMANELESLRRIISEGRAENARIVDQLRAVRNADNGAVKEAN